MYIHWSDNPLPDCTLGHQIKWKVWTTLAIIKMTVFCISESIAFYFKAWLENNMDFRFRLNQFRSTIELFSLFWFVLGNMWIMGEDYSDCKHAFKSPIYKTGFSFIVINYIQLLFPCILGILMIPVFLFCMPTLVRFLNILSGRRNVEGADTAAIDTIPSVLLGSSGNDASVVNPENNPCPICLNDMVNGEYIRNLPCKHIFHKEVRNSNQFKQTILSFVHLSYLH